MPTSPLCHLIRKQHREYSRATSNNKFIFVTCNNAIPVKKRKKNAENGKIKGFENGVNEDHSNKQKNTAFDFF